MMTNLFLWILVVATIILVGTCFSQGIKAQTTLSSAQLRTSGSVPSSNSSANTKPNVTTSAASSNNTSHQAAVPLLSSPKSSPVSSVDGTQQQKQQAELSQGHQQQQLEQTNQLQQQRQPQSSSIDPNQVLLPSFPYQLQQQQQQQPQQQPLVPPIANAGVSQIADANTNVMLDGRNSLVPILQQQANTTTIVGIDNNKMIIAYQWTQIPVGVPVNMNGANTPTPTFTSPMLPYDTTLAFSLQVMSNDGQVSSN
jgi:hypothetical protein